LLKRVEGLIISVLIMTDIYKYIYDKIGYIGIIIIIYIILVMISYYYEEINKFYEERRIIINMDNLNNIRNNHTILGTFIHNLIQLMRDLFEGIEVHNYFHLYISTVKVKEGRLINFESTVGALDDIWRWEIKNKVSVYMYIEIAKKVGLSYLVLFEWYLRAIQYKKEENKRMAEEMHKGQIKKIRDALFFLWELDKYMMREENYKTYYDEPFVYGTNDLTYGLKRNNFFNDKGWEMKGTKDYHPDISENIEHYLEHFYDDSDYMLTFNDAIVEEKCKEMESYGEEKIVRYWVENEELVKKVGEELKRVIEEIKKEWEEIEKNK